MQMIKQCFFFLVLGTAALFMPHANALCTSSDLPKQINVASVSVSSTLPVGATIPGTEQTVHVAGNCYNPSDFGLPIVACYYGAGLEIPGLSGVYESGLEGIGVALMNDKGQRITGAGEFTVTQAARRWVMSPTTFLSPLTLMSRWNW